MSEWCYQRYVSESMLNTTYIYHNQTVEIGWPFRTSRWLWWMLSSDGLEAIVVVWAKVLSWNTKLLEAQLTQDHSEHVGVCRYSTLKCCTGVSYNSQAEKWWNREVMGLNAIILVDSSQTSATVSESTDVKVGCLDQYLQLSIHRQPRKHSSMTITYF